MLAEIQKALPNLTEHDYNRLVWLFDHAYVAPKDSSEEAEAHEYKKMLLENAGIVDGILTEAGMNVVAGSGSLPYYITTTDEELDDIIDVVQQMAIWNIIGDYSDSYNLEIYRAEQGSLTYRDFTEDTSFLERLGDVYATRQFGSNLNAEVERLYRYLVTESDRQADSYDANTQNVTFQTTAAEIEKDGSRYIVGPFRLQKESNVDYTLSLSVTNNNSSVTNYTLLNSSKQAVSGGTTIKDLVGSNFYISIPDSVSLGTIRLTVNGTYYGTNVTYWTVSGREASEQPIVIIEKGNNNFSDSTEVEYVPEYFDLSLRKFITAINGVSISQNDTRVPNIDISPLNDGNNTTTTTANYRHRKDPIEVKRNDIVTYTIRVYNEGDIDGYVREITDHLPEQLEFIEGDSLNSQYGWDVSSDGRTLTTDITSQDTTHRTEQSRLYGTRTNGTLLTAFNGSNLDYIEVQVNCRVKNTNFSGVITNIAEISDFSDENGDYIVDRDSQADNLNLPNDANLPDYRGNTSNTTDLTNSNYHYKGQQDDDDFEKLILPAPTGSYKLQLIKVDENNENTKLEGAIFRITLADGSVHNVTTDANGMIDLGTINMSATGTDVIKIEEVTAPEGYDKIFNSIEVTVTKELDSDGNYIVSRVDITNAEGSGVESSARSKVSLQSGIITVTVPNKRQTQPEGNYKLQLIKVDSEDEGIKLQGATFKITFPDGSSRTETTDASGMIDLGQIDIEEVGTDIITIEEITAPSGYDKLFNMIEVTVTKELNSSSNYVATKVEITKLEGTQIVNGETVKVNLSNGVVTVTVPNKKIREFDLSLRKFITAVNNEALVNEDGSYTREPVVDVSPLINGTGTTAIYNHTKEPVAVARQDIVTYTIRVYNEGSIDGYVKEITDHLPEQLEFIINDELNVRYGWKVSENGRTITTDITSPDTEYSATRDEIYASRTTEEDKVLLKAFDGNELDYIDVQVRCRVKNDIDVTKKITNIADITDFANENNEPVRDRDSEEDNVELPSDEDLPGYKDDEIASGEEYIPGQEDDDDFEKLILEEIVPKFDLALRKFITGVNETQIDNRVPVFTITEDGKYVYEHTKDPVDVQTGDIVTYTIRIYNEGNMAGYAELVKDDIPDGLLFLPENQTNIDYRWKMYREDGTETTNPEEADYIETDYLSKAQEDETGRENLLQAFNPEEMTQPDYHDIEVAFEVTEPNTSDRIIINHAQISEDADEDGNPVDDEDSVPDEWNEGEDDQDIEKIKVKYYDLALRKWVTESIVTYNGKTTVTQTGNTAEMDPEPPAKVEIRGSRMSKTTVKFRFKIRVTNEGEIAGHVGEISDYIPEGLRFIQTDNPEWKEVDGKVVTDQLKDTLLQPGESAEVEIVLTWINGEEHLGLMTNVAEISKDDGDDIDSTPNNQKEGEDDQDDAPVIISITTGAADVYRYIGLTAGVLAILSGGIILIKKFVI